MSFFSSVTGLPVERNEQLVVSRPRPARVLRPSQVTVPVTPLEILPYRPTRLALSILNTGAALVVLGTNATVSLTNGFPIPGGTAISLDQYIGPVWLIAAAPTLVGILEMEL